MLILSYPKMVDSMEIIDPLIIKIQELLTLGAPNPLNQARLRYGSEEDIRTVSKILADYQSEINQYVFVDFTPFERIGHLDTLLDSLKQFQKTKPVLLIVSETILGELRRLTPELPIMVIKFTGQGKFEKIMGGSKSDHNLREIVLKEVKSKTGEDLINFRKRVADYNLTKLLYEPGCLDIPSAMDSKFRHIYLSGRYYRIMPNDMLVSCYLNLKQIGKSYKALTAISYEIVLAIMEYFKRDFDPLKKFEFLVSPNNTSLFLAASVQAILEKPVIIVDKLGPIPALNLNTRRLSGLLDGKTVIVIEEVVATGNEVDRSILFLSNLNSEVHKIIALYNLEVGNPLLLKENQMISLCRPKKALKYEYRSQ